MPTANGVAESPTKKDVDKRSNAGSPTKSPSKSAKSLPRTPETPSSTIQEKKSKRYLRVFIDLKTYLYVISHESRGV